ncbi:MAG: signal peptide peptidase SppA [Puia sp.]|nr:signal peptide peptidase SppA [Puia sp.]
MGGFFKSFFAALLALVAFTVVVVFVLLGIVGGLASSKKENVGAKAVLVIDLSHSYREQMKENPLANIGANDSYNGPGVYDLVRLVRQAKKDSSVRGIYLKCNSNANGFATSQEIRNALIDFKSSGKFVLAYGDVIPQKAYYVASIADKIYCNPKGGVEWKGFASELFFLKGTLQKLEIQPQIFYAGKFKSATEPLREDKMTDANRLQMTELLNGFFNSLLYSTASARGLDTTELRKAVNENLIRFPEDALRYKLVDGLKYDDELKDEMRDRMKVSKTEFLNFIELERYATAAPDYKAEGKDKIALIYAEGDIVDGKGDKDQIGSDTYRWLIKKARLDKNIKAIVFRVNSGGGSSLASENIWRELTLAKESKPVVVSFGDVAASGGYYLSCNADSIFAQSNTITGSIGVFGLVPNMRDFFKDKLGVTFDGVKTAPEADGLTVTKPLSEIQKRFFQDNIDSIYHDFKSRVAGGRKKTMEYVDSIAQGRVWSGEKALQLGLVDRLGNMQDAIDCAARMARTSDYQLKEYPEPRSFLDLLLGDYKKSVRAQAVEEELGEDGYKTFNALKRIKAMTGISQARLPFDFSIE